MVHPLRKIGSGSGDTPTPALHRSRVLACCSPRWKAGCVGKVGLPEGPDEAPCRCPVRDSPKALPVRQVPRHLVVPDDPAPKHVLLDHATNLPPVSGAQNPCRLPAAPPERLVHKSRDSL